MPMTEFLLRLSAWLPKPLRAIASEARIRLLVQFFMFGMAGMVGFVFDTATVYGLRRAMGLYGAGIAAYFVAATVTWICNRFWTFRRLAMSDPWHIRRSRAEHKIHD